LEAALDNLDTFHKALVNGARLQDARFGFIHAEPLGVLAVDQKGGWSKSRTDSTLLVSGREEACVDSPNYRRQEQPKGRHRVLQEIRFPSYAKSESKPVEKKTTLSSVSQMVRETSGDPAFTESFEKRLQARRITKDLMVQRAVHRLSQKDIAEKMGCTQSRISKLESTNDGDLCLGDLARYSDALALRVKILLEDKDCTPVARVKSLAFQIKHEMDALAGLAANDHLIAKGVSDFFGEAFFNLVNMLQNSAQKLPTRPEDGSPYISFEICIKGTVEPDEGKEPIELASHSEKRMLSLPSNC
jgi:transcriptional regulator with XRE-family HTH domain